MQPFFGLKKIANRLKHILTRSGVSLSQKLIQRVNENEIILIFNIFLLLSILNINVSHRQTETISSL